MREALLQLLQVPGEPLAHLVDMLDEAGLQDAVEHGIADGAGQRIAAIGRAVRARDHRFGHLALGEAGAEREAAADALGHRHDVGLDAGPLMREELAGPAIAALHLVEDQQHAVLVAERAQAAHELGASWR